jgi:hypothetical protein
MVGRLLDDPGLIVVSVVLLSIAGIVGSCSYDYATSVRETHEVTIIDKRHVPGHYVTDCDTTYTQVGDTRIPLTTCHQRWVAPTWSLCYEDGIKRFWTTTSESTYHQYRGGDRTWLMFDEGGFFGGRYNERFSQSLPSVER